MSVDCQVPEAVEGVSRMRQRLYAPLRPPLRVPVEGGVRGYLGPSLVQSGGVVPLAADQSISCRSAMPHALT